MPKDDIWLVAAFFIGLVVIIACMDGCDQLQVDFDAQKSLRADVDNKINPPQLKPSIVNITSWNPEGCTLNTYYLGYGPVKLVTSACAKKLTILSPNESAVYYDSWFKEFYVRYTLLDWQLSDIPFGTVQFLGWPVEFVSSSAGIAVQYKNIYSCKGDGCIFPDEESDGFVVMEMTTAEARFQRMQLYGLYKVIQ